MKKQIINIDNVFNSHKKITQSNLNLYKGKINTLNDKQPIYKFNFLKT